MHVRIIRIPRMRVRFGITVMLMRMVVVVIVVGVPVLVRVLDAVDVFMRVLVLFAHGSTPSSRSLLSS